MTLLAQHLKTAWSLRSGGGIQTSEHAVCNLSILEAGRLIASQAGINQVSCEIGAVSLV